MTAMPKATGLFETHLTVSDLDRSIEFYRDVVGLPLALVLRGARSRVLLDRRAGGGDARPVVAGFGADGAFRSTSRSTRRCSDVLAACDGLRSNGVTPLSFFGARRRSRA